MPRVTNTGDAVTEWAEKTGEIPTWWDLCLECAHLNEFPCLGVEGRNEPGGAWEIGAEHPPYGEMPYSCEVCSKKLTEEDT